MSIKIWSFLLLDLFCVFFMNIFYRRTSSHLNLKLINNKYFIVMILLVDKILIVVKGNFFYTINLWSLKFVKIVCVIASNTKMFLKLSFLWNAGCFDFIFRDINIMLYLKNYILSIGTYFTLGTWLFFKYRFSCLFYISCCFKILAQELIYL